MTRMKVFITPGCFRIGAGSPGISPLVHITRRIPVGKGLRIDISSGGVAQTSRFDLCEVPEPHTCQEAACVRHPRLAALFSQASYRRLYRYRHRTSVCKALERVRPHNKTAGCVALGSAKRGQGCFVCHIRTRFAATALVVGLSGPQTFKSIFSARWV